MKGKAKKKPTKEYRQHQKQFPARTMLEECIHEVSTWKTRSPTLSLGNWAFPAAPSLRGANFLAPAAMVERNLRMENLIRKGERVLKKKTQTRPLSILEDCWRTRPRTMVGLSDSAGPRWRQLYEQQRVLLAYDNAGESDTGLGNATLDQCKLQMSFPGLRLPSGDGCDFERAHSMSRCWRARTHIDAMGKWIEFELHLHGSPKHRNSPR